MRSKLAAAVLSGADLLARGDRRPRAGPPTRPRGRSRSRTTSRPVFRSRCGSCHNADKQKGGLNLDNFGAAMQGGGSGKVVEPGDPDGSTLLQVVTHKEEPKMPPNAPKLPDAEIEVIRKWIEGGALENSGSVASAKAKPKFEFKLDPASLGKPAGPPAMPENVATEPFVPQAKPGAVVAMAASPWAPLVAIAGHKQVLLYRTTDYHLAGVLPFPEGTIHALKFSRNGDLLLAGGGRGGQSGLAVVWDVKKGKRVFEVGKEYDIVLAADISPDHGLVALGGPSKVVRVYNTADGSLAYEMKKHTEWITAIEFSPDGVLLATGDRNNGLIVWEAQTGREFYDLRGHTAAITDVSWRLDSNVLASSSEDGDRQALGDGERRRHQEHRRPRRRGRLGPVRQGRPAGHHRPRPRRPALGCQREQAARFRSVQRPGSRSGVHLRRFQGHRRRLVGRGPGLGREGRSTPGEPRGQPRAHRRATPADEPATGDGAGRDGLAGPATDPGPDRDGRRAGGSRPGPGQGLDGRADRREAERDHPAARPGEQGEGEPRPATPGPRSRRPSNSWRRRQRPSRRPKRPSTSPSRPRRARPTP